MTVVAPSKRDLREGVHFYNLDSHPQRPSQIKNHQTADAATFTRSKRRRPQSTQTPAVERAQSKRPRASDSHEAGEQLRELSNSKPPLAHVEGSTSSNQEGSSGSDVTNSEDSDTPREPGSMQRGPQLMPSTHCGKDAASSCQSLLESANLPSHRAESPPYEVWDSRPRLSMLTEVKPDLRPSTWESASDYGSLSDLFAPK